MTTENHCPSGIADVSSIPATRDREKLVLNIFGWFGVVAVAAAYSLLLLGFLKTNSVVYLLLNIVGSVAILLDAWNAKNYQPVVLNMFWALVALISLVSSIF